MPILRSFLATALLGLTLCVGNVYAADPPSADAIQQSLDKLPDRKLPDEMCIRDRCLGMQDEWF